MARVKYKLGTFVKVAENDEDPPAYGAVEEIRQTVDGVQYKLTNLDEPVSEDEIAEAYRAIKPREPKAARTRAAKGKKRAAEANAQA